MHSGLARAVHAKTRSLDVDACDPVDVFAAQPSALAFTGDAIPRAALFGTGVPILGFGAPDPAKRLVPDGGTDTRSIYVTFYAAREVLRDAAILYGGHASVVFAEAETFVPCFAPHFVVNAGAILCRRARVAYADPEVVPSAELSQNTLGALFEAGAIPDGQALILFAHASNAPDFTQFAVSAVCVAAIGHDFAATTTETHGSTSVPKIAWRLVLNALALGHDAATTAAASRAATAPVASRSTATAVASEVPVQPMTPTVSTHMNPNK